jgi:hypothetical protein
MVLYHSIVRPASTDFTKHDRHVYFDWSIQEQFDKIDQPIANGRNHEEDDGSDDNTG